MKVLITSHTYYPMKNGVQNVTQYLAEGLVKNGHEVTVLTNLYPSIKEREETNNGVKIIRFDVKTVHALHFGEKKAYIDYVLKNNQNYDVMVNVCTQTVLTDSILPFLDKIKIPKVLYLHSMYEFKYSKEHYKNLKLFLGKIWTNLRWGFFYRINKENFKKYNSVISLHELDYATNYFKNKYDIKPFIIQNGVEKEFYNTNINNKKDKKYLINVSNYLPVKNQERLLKIFLNLSISNEWELLLIGSSDNDYYYKLKKIYDDYLSSEKDKNNKKTVHMLYNISREDIYNYVKNASLYVMTSNKEGFPISLIEGCAAGVPFVSSDVGIVKYLPGGVVCNNNAEFEFWLIKFISDEKLISNYSLVAKKEAESKYMINNKIKDFEQLLCKIVGGK